MLNHKSKRGTLEPMLKYPGGKRRELDKLLPYVPKTFNHYIEPFFGGGAMYFCLSPEHGILVDNLPLLMDFYKTVRDQYPLLSEQLEAVQEVWNANQDEYEEEKENSVDLRIPNKNEALYYYMRDVMNGHKQDEELLPAVVYYYINRLAYAGQVRYNSEGEFNIPFGHYKHFNIHHVSEEHSELLHTADYLECADYHEALAMAKPDDFVFLDPPYDTRFKSYGAGMTFTEDNHRELAGIYRTLPCPALLVINKTELTMELYREFVVAEYGHTYNTNIKNRYNRESVHLIVCNYN